MGIIEKMRLDGKKGFVTGAARGIGKCTATAFAEAGADVAIVDIDFEEAKKTAKEIGEKTGRKVIPIRTDCTDQEQVEAMVDQVVKELGGLNFCHNNAGICLNVPAGRRKPSVRPMMRYWISASLASPSAPVSWPGPNPATVILPMYGSCSCWTSGYWASAPPPACSF